MQSTLQEILGKLPHGAEFRFVDRILEIVPGKSATGEYTIRGDESFLRAHFPGDPLFPGVLLIEAGAQMLGILAQSNPSLNQHSELRLAAVHKAKIAGSARPGDTFQIFAKVAGRIGHLTCGDVRVRLNGTDILQAEITLSDSRPKES